MNNLGLNIVVARVEQDNYEARNIKVIKADGTDIEKDLYIEQEFMNGEIYSASDNVMVSLHRTLNSGEKENLKLIASNGQILTDPLYSKIIMLTNNLFICVKASSDMISVKNNQMFRVDPTKNQEIIEDSESIKKQVQEMMYSANPIGANSFKFVYEDPYNEASVYKLEKVDNLYNIELISDKVSFIAYDGYVLYSHSNIVTDITKMEVVDTVSTTDSKIDIKETTLDSINDLASISASDVEVPDIKIEEEIEEDTEEDTVKSINNTNVSNEELDSIKSLIEDSSKKIENLNKEINSLISKVSLLEAKINNFEYDKSNYITENKKLKEDAYTERAKIDTAIISLKEILNEANK